MAFKPEKNVGTLIVRAGKQNHTAGILNVSSRRCGALSETLTMGDNSIEILRIDWLEPQQDFFAAHRQPFPEIQ
jgi:hypothetical protein